MHGMVTQRSGDDFAERERERERERESERGNERENERERESERERGEPHALSHQPLPDYQPSESDQIAILETPSLHRKTPDSGELRCSSRRRKGAM